MARDAWFRFLKMSSISSMKLHLSWILLVFMLSSDQPLAGGLFGQSRKLGYEVPVQHLEHQADKVSKDLLKAGRLPWLQPPDYVPATAEHVNNLSTLIESQRHHGVRWLTVFAVSNLVEGTVEHKVLLNTLTTFLLLGGGKTYIIAVAKAEGLATCMRLRLPCYNATAAVPPEYLNTYIGGTWSKIFMVRHVLQHMPSDLNLHFSDHDVIYLKRLYPSLSRFTEAHAFDIAGQLENYPMQGINTGVLFGRNTPRLHTMYDNWVGQASLTMHDQDTFMRAIGNITFVQRLSEPDVLPGSAKDTRAHLIRFRTPWLDRSWCRWCTAEYTNCYQGDTPHHCPVTWRLFVHTICVPDKIRYTQGLGLWFLSTDNPLATNWTAVAAAALPCSHQRDTAILEVEPFY